LVALARPDATFVAGFKAWLSLGYFVKKSERAIRIIAPMPAQRDRDTGEDSDETRILFKTVFVFDRAQVAALPNGEPTPLGPPCEPLTGESHAHLLPRLEAFARSLGFSVAFEPIAGAAGGWCDSKAKRIVVDAAAPANARLRALIHEVVHALGVGYADYGRERAEVIVDKNAPGVRERRAAGRRGVDPVCGRLGRGRRAGGGDRVRQDDRRARAPRRGGAGRRSGAGRRVSQTAGHLAGCARRAARG
jgi:hypothetical protein